MTWINIGDINPECGTTVVKDLALDHGDFSARGVQITPESDVGGSDHVFLIAEGELFLSEKNFQSALDIIGYQIKDDILFDAHNNSFKVDSDEGLLTLAHAAQANSGIEGEHQMLISIGLPSQYDQDPKFDADITFFDAKTTLWSALRCKLDLFDYAPEENPQTSIEINTSVGPYQGMPRHLNTRADLSQIKAFQFLDCDQYGNPKTYLNTYLHASCEDALVSEGHGGDRDIPEWTELSTCEEDSDCFECHTAVSPTSASWIGPKEADLIDLWKTLPACDVAQDNTPEPDF